MQVSDNISLLKDRTRQKYFHLLFCSILFIFEEEFLVKRISYEVGLTSIKQNPTVHCTTTQDNLFSLHHVRKLRHIFSKKVRILDPDDKP